MAYVVYPRGDGRMEGHHSGVVQLFDDSGAGGGGGTRVKKFIILIMKLVSDSREAVCDCDQTQ